MLLLGSFHRAEISSDTPGPGLDHRARGVCHSLSSQDSVLLGCPEVGEAEWGLGPAFGLMMGELCVWPRGGGLAWGFMAVQYALQSDEQGQSKGRGRFV